MNIFGIGTDIVAIDRIRKIWQRFGEAFARRILAKSEFEDLNTAKDKIAFLAKRYAAKEALAKALGTGFQRNGIRLTEIAVKNDTLGKPYLEFEAGTQKEMENKHIRESHLSLSDERDFAIAFVILIS